MNDAIFPKTERAALLVIDVQTRLFSVMPEAEQAPLVKRSVALIELAKKFGWEIAWAEQNPEKLGPTEPTIDAALRAAGATPHPKMAFSCVRDENFEANVLPKLPPHVVVIGIETHVCVLQTIADLQSRGHQCFVPLDCVASRDPRHYENGLRLIEKVGAVVTNTESLLFHALQKAGTDTFRQLAPLVR